MSKGNANEFYFPSLSALSALVIREFARGERKGHSKLSAILGVTNWAIPHVDLLEALNHSRPEVGQNED